MCLRTFELQKYTKSTTNFPEFPKLHEHPLALDVGSFR